MELYIVTSTNFCGEVNIEAVFSSEKLAEDYLKKKKEKHTDCEFDIGTFTIDAEVGK